MSENDWWFVLLAFEVVGLWGQWIVGRRLWWGWAVVMVHSVPWFLVAITYGRYGAALMPLGWWAVNGWNLRKWWREYPRTAS